MKKKLPPLENIGSLITYKEDDKFRCLNYLFHFEGHGVYDPQFGKVPVTPEQAKIHNQLLSEAQITGLDQSCAVGMHGSLYYHKNPDRVQTWTGTLVSDDVKRIGISKVIEFKRKGMRFRGTLRKDTELLHFRRVA